MAESFRRDVWPRSPPASQTRATPHHTSAFARRHRVAFWGVVAHQVTHVTKDHVAFTLRSRVLASARSRVAASTRVPTAGCAAAPGAATAPTCTPERLRTSNRARAKQFAAPSEPARQSAA
eukprot:Amastigsp_a677433_19.p3 type:complete len:121 gc:universal Amastigsp_a677433_19:1409-1047(-)